MENLLLRTLIGLWLLFSSGVKSNQVMDRISVDDSFGKDVLVDLNYITCGEKITLNNTYFVNPDYPAETNTGKICRVTFGQIAEGICQLKLEFSYFVLAEPNDDGNCVSDKFTVQGLSYPIPSLCGYNADQHMYIDFDPEYNLPSFIVSMDADVTVDRIFSIKIIQIPCDAPYKAPSGCLQYFTSPSGTVQSFGYPSNPWLSYQRTVTKQLANQQYDVCIRPENGYCSITWTSDPDNVPYHFLVSGVSSTVHIDDLGTLYVSNYGDHCTKDYVIIPGGSFTVNSGQPPESFERFCGLGFPNSVTSDFRPFQLFVKTDDAEFANLADEGNLGFSLNFKQNLC